MASLGCQWKELSTDRCAEPRDPEGTNVWDMYLAAVRMLNLTPAQIARANDFRQRCVQTMERCCWRPLACRLQLVPSGSQ